MPNKNKEPKKVVELPTPSPIEATSIKFTRSIGTPTSVLLHTIFFIVIFFLKNFGYTIDQILLILTTAVSLEAIYLAIFIQMTINRQEAKLAHVHDELEEISEDIEDIQEDVEELGEDFDEITEDIGEIQEDVKELGVDFEEISEDIEGLQEDVKELGEDFDEITEDMQEDDKKEEAYRKSRNDNLKKMESALQSIIAELEKMKEQNNRK